MSSAASRVSAPRWAGSPSDSGRRLRPNGIILLMLIIITVMMIIIIISINSIIPSWVREPRFRVTPSPPTKSFPTKSP